MRIKRDAFTLINMARLGGNIIINANEYSILDIINIARSLTPSSSLIVKRAYILSEYELQTIAKASFGRRVTFDFS